MNTSAVPTPVQVPAQPPVPAPTTSIPSSTTVVPLFMRKPPLICHLVSPGHYSPGSTRHIMTAQTVPSASICDYILLDLPLLPNGTYEYISYIFLTTKGTGHRLLFNFDLDETNRPHSVATARSPTFLDTMQVAQLYLRPHKVCGLGVVNGLPILASKGTTIATIAFLDEVYTRFKQVLNMTGVPLDDIRNFFAFKPDMEVVQTKYQDYLTLLNYVNGLSIVIILTITDEEMREVMPSSSWVRGCLPQMNQSTMYDALMAILGVRNPKVNFTLAMSLRLDMFEGASLTDVHGSYLKRIPAAYHQAYTFETNCQSKVFSWDPKGSRIFYMPAQGCAFAPGHDPTSEVFSFETPFTISKKMTAMYRMLGHYRTAEYVVGWTVYNMTYSLAPNACLGKHNRILEIRKILDENKFY